MQKFRKSIDEMAGYVPGEQPAPGRRVIKLNTNENPYPPSPKALAALRELDWELLRRYPDPMSSQVRKAISEVFGVPQGRVLVGNGSDELLTMICRACLESGRPAAYPMPTYVYYRTLTQIQDAKFIEVPFDEDYNLPIDGLIKAGGAVTFVASPNSPSGTRFGNDALEKLARGVSGLLVIDEAYTDFADGNALELVDRHENVIVLRTLSKGYSLAGLRVGFAVANERLLPNLIKVKDHYNLDAAAAAVATAAIFDQPHKTENARKVKLTRKTLTDGLARLGCKVWPSEANFVLARPPAGDARRIYQTLKDRGILVRYFDEPRLDDKLRITVGSDEQNAALLTEMGKL
ncbi:MAG: histidinol-phosphate transaminase [Planctomycetes bacterium]|nr:histidinol-phosphate transaminase [Planctomycetota bacterium]